MGENKARSPLRAWTAAQHERDDSLICPFSNCKVLQKRQHAHLSSLKLQSTTKEMTISPVLSQTAEQHERDGTLICPFSNCKKLWTRQHTHLSFLKLQNSMNEMTHSITGPFSNCRTLWKRAHSPVLSQIAEHFESNSTLTCPFSNYRTLWKRQHTHLSFLKLVLVGLGLAQVPPACVPKVPKDVDVHVGVGASRRLLARVNVHLVAHHW